MRKSVLLDNSGMDQCTIQTLSAAGAVVTINAGHPTRDCARPRRSSRLSRNNSLSLDLGDDEHLLPDERLVIEDEMDRGVRAEATLRGARFRFRDLIVWNSSADPGLL